MGKFKKIKQDTFIKDISLIKQGDNLARENFINKYMPFIIDRVSKVTGRYIDINNDDELSIGLLAFNEAIDKFDQEKGNFFTFSELLIRNKVIDFLKKEEKHKKNINIDDNVNICETNDFIDKLSIKHELEKLKDNLLEFGISISNLVASSPKHYDSRENLINLAIKIAQEPIILQEIYHKKRLPRNLISDKYKVSIKVINTNRKFLITCIIIFDKNYSQIKEYLIGKGGAEKIE